jgi:hypothetical protein
MKVNWATTSGHQAKVDASSKLRLFKREREREKIDLVFILF